MKQLSNIVAIILGAIIALAIGLRIALGIIIGSDSFRGYFNDYIERSLHSVMPTLMSEIKDIELSGVANLLLQDITIRNSRKISATLNLKRLLITPELSTLFIGESWHFDIEAMFGDYGRLTIHGSTPKWILRAPEAGRTYIGAVRLEGTAVDIDAVAVSNIIFSDKAAPSFYLSRGLLGGDVHFSKPLRAPEAAGRKNGRFNGALRDAVWMLADENNKPLLIPKTQLNLEMIDNSMFIRSPLTLEAHTGQANITGSVLLPRQASDDAAWNLIVNVDNDSGLSKSLAKLFKCKEPVTVSHYTVKGPVTAASCTP